jgi:hypothetical protein
MKGKPEKLNKSGTAKKSPWAKSRGQRAMINKAKQKAALKVLERLRDEGVVV